MTDLAAYQAAESGYHAFGEEMNRQWRAYQRGATTPEACEVHILDAMHGRRVERWRVGEQVKREAYEKFKDRSGFLYAVVAYEKGEPQMSLVAKAMWDQVAQQFGDIDTEAAVWLDKTKRGLGMK